MFAIKPEHQAGYEWAAKHFGCAVDDLVQQAIDQTGANWAASAENARQAERVKLLDALEAAPDTATKAEIVAAVENEK